MTTTPILLPTSSAVSGQTLRYHANGSGEVTFHASGLAGAETYIPYIGGSNGWVQLFDTAGAPILITATKPQLVLPAGPIYAFNKDATVSPSGLDASHNHPSV